MRLFYGFGIRVFYGIMWVASLLHPKAKKWIQGRKEPWPNVSHLANRNVVWFHCASLGEFDQGLPVMNAYKAQYPNDFLLVTFFSPSGMEYYNKRDHLVDLAVYLPLDTKTKAQKFVSHFNPKLVFFVKYEFWYNHLKCARRNGAKIYGVSSLFRSTHRFFKWYGGFFRKSLRFFDYFFTQDERSKALLASIGITQAMVTGDTRYDRMMAVVEKTSKNEVIHTFKGDDKLIILGSMWPVDLEMLFPALDELLSSYKLLFAPHVINEKLLLQIEQAFDNQCERFTRFQNTGQKVLILDTIGHLTSAYQYADIAYVGGGFSGSLHNILEPGAFGVPIIIGPKYHRFPEAILFTEQEVTFSVGESLDFERAVEKINQQNTVIKEKLHKLFQQNKGAASKVIAFLQEKC